MKIKGLTRIVVGLVCVLFSVSAFSANHINVSKQKHVPGELIVKLRQAQPGKGIQRLVISSLQKKFGSTAVLDMKPFITDGSLYKIRMVNGTDLAMAISILGTENAVEFAEPNIIYHALDTGMPNDPDFIKTWGIKNTGQTDAAGQVGISGADINVMPLWREGIHGNQKTLVAVIDTGVSWDHPDLAANIYTNPGEAGDKSGNGVDDDKNGFIDDVHGWNFVANNNNSRDDNGHGTHCSGTIGAVGNNGIGVAGINWNVSILPVKFLDSQGSGTLEAAVDAINYAKMMKVQVMSNSWGGGAESQTMIAAIQAAKDAGILFVAAAGNDSSNNDNSPSYPASTQVDNVVAVAATDNKDQLATFSNYGPKTVHVAAPGVKVYSTVLDGKYEAFSGTSMATPHVAGVAALLWSENPTWTFAQIKDRMIKTSDPVPGLRRKVIANGRINAYSAFHGIVPPSTDPDPSLWKDVPQVIESAHPYLSNQNLKFTVHADGAKYIRIHFEKIETEFQYDKITIEDKAGKVVEILTGAYTDYYTDYYTGDSLVIHLESDGTVDKWGFKVDKIQMIPGK